MRRFFVPFSIILMLYSSAFAESSVQNITVHCEDQFNRKSNDATLVTGHETRGQTFIPSRKEISFIRVKAFKTKAVSGKNEKDQLSLSLWTCCNEYNETKETQPLALAADPINAESLKSLYYRVNARVSLSQPYFFEIAAPSASYQVRSQYLGDAYANGDFVVRNERRGSCDMDFSTYYPEKLTEGIVLEGAPEIIEIAFNTDMDTTRTRFGINGSVVAKTEWTGKNKITLILNNPLNSQIVKEPLLFQGKAFTDSGLEEKLEIPFSIAKKDPMPERTKIEAAVQRQSGNLEHGRLIRGITGASLSQNIVDKDIVELSLNAYLEPLTGMQTPFDKIDEDTLNKFSEHNINTISIVLPDFIEKPELLFKVKSKLELIHKKGFLSFWLVSLAPAGYDKNILGDNPGTHKTGWNNKTLKEYCFNNPEVHKAFLSKMEQYVRIMKERNMPLDGIIVNEPSQVTGEFCYCSECRSRFEQMYSMPMPYPVNLKEEDAKIPVDWPAGIPKKEHIKDGEKEAWKNMSAFYGMPTVGRISEIFKIFRASYPNISCQVTTLTDIAPFYGIDFFGKVIELENLDGIQTAIYWAVGRKAPETVGDKAIANKFIKAAKEHNLSCCYWLQGYDTGDHSGPLKPGDIKIAVNEAFAQGVDGILIWSYLNPILGPWNKPYHWPEYFGELKDALKPHLKKHETTGKFTVKRDGKNEFSMENGEIIFKIGAIFENDGTISVSIKVDGYCSYKTKINIKKD